MTFNKHRMKAGTTLLFLMTLSGAGYAADDNASLRADIEELKKQVREANEWKKADSTVHLAGYGSVGYTDRRNSENGTFSVGSFAPIFHYQYKDLLMMEAEVEMGYNPDGEYLIAGSLTETPLPAGAQHDTPNGKLYLIHPAHGHVMLTVPVAGWSHHQAITPDGRNIFSTHATRSNVSVLDRVDNRIVHTIETGPAPNYTVVTRDGKQAFVNNSGNGTISEIDLKTWKVKRTLEAGPIPKHMVPSRDEKTIYNDFPVFI